MPLIERTSNMANDSSRDASRRRPTKRTSSRETTTANPHYSKLTRTSTVGSTSSRSRSSQSKRSGSSSKRSSGQRNAQQADQNRVQGFQSLSTDARQRVYGKRANRRRKSQGNVAALIVGLAVIAAFIFGGVYFWTHRTVNLTVNGSHAKIRINSTLADLYNELGISTQPGNYISVSGNVIEEEKGYVFNASVNGEDLSRKKTNEYRIHGGEKVEFSDGSDRMEKYDVEVREVQPKLVFDGSWGSVSFVKQWGKVGQQEIRTGKETGETAEGDWIEELQDCVIRIKNLEPADGQKLVALTFDDGPAYTYTEEYLRILEEHDAKATFFNLAENEEMLPDLAVKVASSGNQICSHTNHHLQLTTLEQEDLIDEITSAHDIILASSGIDTTIIRPPYGDFSQSCWLKSQGTISASILWNQDTLDWSMPGVDVIVENAMANITSGSVILMHDGGGDRSQDLEALPQIIERLKSSGYKLVTISELMASDPEVPESIVSGDAEMPKDAVWPTEIAESEEATE